MSLHHLLLLLEERLVCEQAVIGRAWSRTRKRARRRENSKRRGVVEHRMQRSCVHFASGKHSQHPVSGLGARRHVQCLFDQCVLQTVSEASFVPAHPGSRHSVLRFAFLSRSAMPAVPPPTDSVAALALAASSAAVCFFGFAFPPMCSVWGCCIRDVVVWSVEWPPGGGRLRGGTRRHAAGSTRRKRV